MPKPTVILGAGLSGLSCAYHLRTPSVVLERTGHVGGAAASTQTQGFTFDCTGHYLHLRDAQLLRWLNDTLDCQLEAVRRQAGVYSFGAYRPYPFQAHTFGLPARVRAQCLLGYARAQRQPPRSPDNFEAFILQRLGRGFAQHFMLPYNEKLWTVPPRDLSAAWCERFVPQPDAAQIIRGALGDADDTTQLGYHAKFYYPKRGGIGRIAQQLHAHLPAQAELRLRCAPRRIDWRKRQVVLPDDTHLNYEALVSTMPLPDLLDLLDDVPDTVRDAAAQLKATSVTYWNIGVAAPPTQAAQRLHWIYFPDKNLPFYRTGSPSSVQPELAPKGQRSLCVEVSHPANMATSVTADDVLRALRGVQLLGPHEDPIFMQQAQLPYAYVIMNQAYGPCRHAIIDWLQSVNIHPAGRYGAWVYDSMESALLGGMRLAAQLPGCGRAVA